MFLTLALHFTGEREKKQRGGLKKERAPAENIINVTKKDVTPSFCLGECPPNEKGDYLLMSNKTLSCHVEGRPRSGGGGGLMCIDREMGRLATRGG